MAMLDENMDNIDLISAPAMAATKTQQQPQFFSQQVREARRFYLDLSPEPQSPLVVVCGGREDCALDYVIDRQSFPYYSLEFVCGGKGLLQLEGKETQLDAGIAYTYGPGIAHNILCDRTEPLKKYFVDFLGEEALALLEKCELGPGRVRRVNAPLDVQRALDDLILHGTRSSGTSSPICNVLMHYILLLVTTTAGPLATNLQPAYSTYLRCRDHIEKHYLRLKSLEEIASETFVDKTYLCRLFQRFDAQTPYQYLTRLKMNHAAELLEDPDLLVKQVAATLHYPDAFHFSRIFKSVFGVSPKQFRQLRS